LFDEESGRWFSLHGSYRSGHHKLHDKTPRDFRDHTAAAAWFSVEKATKITD
jgi:hypothetical protein